VRKILLIATLFIAFAGKSIASDWVYSESKDEMRDKVRHAATLMSEKELSSTPDSAMSLEVILLSDDAGVSDKAGLNLSKAQYSCKTDEQCDVKIRFDNGKIETLYISTTDPNNILLLIDEPRAFVEKLRLSKRVIVELPVRGRGRSQFKFFPDGLKWQGVDSGRRYLSEFGGINLRDKIDLSGKDASKKPNGVICFDDKLEVIIGWVTQAKICTYDGMVSFISIKEKNGKKRARELVTDINKALGSKIKINNGVAMWLSDKTLGISSIWIVLDKKEELSMDFFYNPASSRIPE